jgi:aspartate racemase
MARPALLGVLGGLGPLASAEFVSTLYRLNPAPSEQEAPACLLLSDPSFPDRTTAILRGDLDPLAVHLSAALERLAGAGADRLLIACITVHVALPRVPEPLRERVVSLLDLAVEELARTPRRRLLLATSGTRAARLFESHPRWPEAAPWIVLPDEAEQAELHDWIYRLKAHTAAAPCLAWVESLAARHGAQGCVFGCTELHLLHRVRAEQGADPLDGWAVDPLLAAARDFRSLVAGASGKVAASGAAEVSAGSGAAGAAPVGYNSVIPA